MIHNFLIEIRKFSIVSNKRYIPLCLYNFLALGIVIILENIYQIKKYNKKILLLTLKYANIQTVDCCINIVI